MKNGLEITAVALTVGGSDSGGGAGIQADLKTFHRLAVFGTSAITCVTAQNPARVTAILPLPARLVAAQMGPVFAAFPVAAVKTGMLYNGPIIRAVASQLRRHRARNVVIDPVMVASSGRVLLEKQAVAVLCRSLLPLAALVTPNLAEAGTLLGRPIRSLAEMRTAARELAQEFGVPFLIKGGHLEGPAPAIDVLCDGLTYVEYRHARIAHRDVHGTGCTLAAAIAAHLARGIALVESIERAKALITQALRRALRVGTHRALNV